MYPVLLIIANVRVVCPRPDLVLAQRLDFISDGFSILYLREERDSGSMIEEIS
jgi:hypothetical protein